LRLSVRRRLAPEKGSLTRAALEIGELKQEIAGTVCSASAEERATQAGWMEIIPWITRLTASPAGEMFVERRTPGVAPGKRIDVFSAEGAYLGTLPIGFPFPTAWTRSVFVTLDRDADDRPVVVGYSIIKGS
jgi:hypothetical protein